MMIQLVSSKIKSFRSLKDTGFFSLSQDNITAVIGQNESGKTSILDALESFSTGKIDPDDLRSENEYPEITCVFKISSDWLDGITDDDEELSRGLKAKIKESDNLISISRIWTSRTEQSITFNHIDIQNIFSDKPIDPPADILTPETETEIVSEVVAEEPKEPVDQKLMTLERFTECVLDNLPEFHKFEDDASLLPDNISIEDIKNKNNKVNGLQGVLNLLEIMKLDVSQLENLSERFRYDKLETNNITFSAEFKKYWSQKIGDRDKVDLQIEFQRYGVDNPELVGKSYLNFWIIENKKRLRPKQRSKGLRWFLSFYLQLQASAVRGQEKRDLILLIDEPAGSLHAKAQEDVLKVFETLKKNIQVIYTTHTHHLLDLPKLYRIIAAQRETVDGDEYSLADTHILSAHQLGAASRDTLTPIFDCMGVSFANQNVIDRTNNVLVEEVSASYYIKALLKLEKITDVHLLPANGTPNIPQLARLLLGWGIKFGVLVDDEQSGKRTLRKIKNELFPGSDNDQNINSLFQVIPNCKGIEDIFSKKDFAKYVLETDFKKIIVDNSQYVKTKGLSKGLLAAKFYNAVEDGTITVEMLKTSQHNISALTKAIRIILDVISPPTITEYIADKV